MRLCGISSRFQLLSPCMRQVTHALLTRPPLSHRIFISEENLIKCFVRLACVKHAASVHPEPGSNSHVIKHIFEDNGFCASTSRHLFENFRLFQARSLWLFNQKLAFLIYCFKVRSFLKLTDNLKCLLSSTSRHLHVNLSRFFTVQLSMFCNNCRIHF